MPPSNFCGERKRYWTEPGRRTRPAEGYVMSRLFLLPLRRESFDTRPSRRVTNLRLNPGRRIIGK
jgi:hypothetical protein